MTQQMASGTGLIEKTAETGAPVPVRRGSRFWVLLAVIVAAVALLAAWTLLQAPGVEERAGEQARVFSNHDSGITLRLRDEVRQDRSDHDSGIAGLVRERRGAQTAHDSGIAAALRERAGSGHDGTNCVPAAPGQGGWEARLSHGC